MLGTSIRGPWPDGHEAVLLGMGCFWNGERTFWSLDGVHTTAAGFTPDHTEVVLVVYDPAILRIEVLLERFLGSHDTSRQPSGPLYRSLIVATNPWQMMAAETVLDRHRAAGRRIATLLLAGTVEEHFSYAAADQQQYLAR